MESAPLLPNEPRRVNHPRSPQQVPTALLPSTETRLLDKYVLPKVALTIITLSSFVGVWLTMSTHGVSEWPAVIMRWLHLVSLGALAGGYMWKGFLAKAPADAATKPRKAADVRVFAAAQFHRFRRVVLVALPIFALTGIFDLVRFSRLGVGWPIWIDAALLASIIMIVLYEYSDRRPGMPYAEQPAARLAVGLLVIDALFQAAFDVTLSQGGAVWPLLVRWAHLAAFGLWFGGAFWNIFIAVPAARQTLSIPVVVAAGQQLERFRVVVRIILPTLIITGFIQAYRFVGLSLDALLYSPVGHIILLKIGLVLTLVGVFLTCPLWRACSPISGMCKLDELYDSTTGQMKEPSA